MPRSSKWSLQVFQPKLCMHFSPHVCHMPLSFNPHHRNNILWRVQIVKLLIMRFTPVSCYFLLFCPANFLKAQKVIIGYKREPATIKDSLNPHKLCGSLKLLLHHCEILSVPKCVLWCVDYISRYFSVKVVWVGDSHRGSSGSRGDTGSSRMGQHLEEALCGEYSRTFKKI